MEETMPDSRKFAILIMSAFFLTVPIDGFCVEARRPNPPMVQMLQEGKAKLSPDYKSIVDDKGNSVAKETSSTIQKKESTALSSDTVKDPSAPPPPMVIFCNKKCAIVSKHCYIDETGNIVCLNVCEKEALVCGE
jgi:hypothetical protein